MEIPPILLRFVFCLDGLPSSQISLQTETIFSTDQHSVSYVQVRGSVPRMFTQARSANVS